MFTEQSLRCGGTKSHSCRPKHFTKQMAGQGKARLWRSYFTVHPLGFYCFRFGSYLASSWARTRPVRTIFWRHNSGGNKISNKMKQAAALQQTVHLKASHTVCITLQKYNLQPHVGAQRNLVSGKNYIFSLDSEMKASYGAFDLPLQTNKNNSIVIYQHKSCMQTKIYIKRTFYKIFFETGKACTTGICMNQYNFVFAKTISILIITSFIKSN